jgi:hypothetical protein
MSDKINHPSHYTNNKIETIDIIKDSLTAEEYRGYVKGNILKYVIRERYKNGDEDLGKARWYLNSILDIANIAEKIIQSNSEHIGSCGMTAKGQGKHECNCEMKSSVNMIGTKKQFKKYLKEQREREKFFCDPELIIPQEKEKNCTHANQKSPKVALGVLLTVIIVLLV